MAQELYLKRRNKITHAITDVLVSPATPITDYTLSVEFMGDSRLTATFEYPSILLFDMTEFVVYEKEGTAGSLEEYYLLSPPTWEKDEKSLMLKYNCVFVPKYEILKNVPMIDSWEYISGSDTARKPSLYQTEYSFFGGAYEYFINIKSSMIAEFGYYIDTFGQYQPNGFNMSIDMAYYPQQGEDISITVSNSNVFSALKDIYEKFKVPFFITSGTYNDTPTSIVVGGEKTYVGHYFRYGKDNGLYKINKTVVSDDVITKIRGVGSQKNLPFNYLQAEKNAAGLANLPMPRLMPAIFRETLASAASGIINVSAVKDYYVSDNYNQNFPKISYETLDDIYPTITGVTNGLGQRIDKINGVYFMATSVSAENSTSVVDDSEQVNNPRFWIKVPALGFDLKSCLNEKEKLVMNMNTGLCGGCKFDVLSIGSRTNQWSGFNVENYYGYDTMDTVEHKNALYVKQDNIYKETVSNTVILPNGSDISYNFSGELKVICTGVTGGNVIVNIEIVLIDETNSVVAEILSFSDLYTGTRTAIVPISIANVLPVNGNNLGHYIKIISNIESTNTGGKLSAELAIDAHSANVQFPITPEQANDTTSDGQWLLVQKDLDSFNTLMPYVINPKWTSYNSPELWAAGAATRVEPSGLVPAIGDEYIFTGITLPQTYITAAEQRLEDALIDILEANKEYKYDYVCGFDEKLLVSNPTINDDMKVGSIVRIYESINPDETINQNSYKEVTVKNISLKYSSDKQIYTQD